MADEKQRDKNKNKNHETITQFGSAGFAGSYGFMCTLGALRATRTAQHVSLHSINKQKLERKHTKTKIRSIQYNRCPCLCTFVDYIFVFFFYFLSSVYLCS